MKKVFLLLLIVGLIAGFNSCTKTDDNTKELCSNGKLDEDNQETEIDCGPHCDTCPSAGKLTALLGTSDYKSIDVAGQVLGPGIRIYAHDASDRFINFAFYYKQPNTPMEIAYAGYDYQGEHWTHGPGDTGTAVVTAIDTLRKIISGTFSVGTTRDQSTLRSAMSNGVFTNVRY